ncbi:MAG TPA: hypothetical protein VHO26_00020 [Propionibacteriaceae bacterium]|nr:hypothetical protein [Propionibacteriaceae bacterium]
MEFTLTIDLDKLSGDRSHEVARILRYWAGAIKAADLEPGSAMNVYDPHFHRVGRWQVTAAPPVAEEPEPEAPVAERAAPPEPPEVPGARSE